jgi:hypothetical protein
MSDRHHVTRSTPAHVAEPRERPLPWEHWSKERRERTALGVAAAVFALGAVVGLLSFWS